MRYFAIIAVSLAILGCSPTPRDLTSLYESRKAELIRTVKEEGIPQGILLLHRTVEHDQELSGLCHGLAHEVGRAAYEKEGLSALQNDDDICGSGYTHGIIETHFVRVADIETALHSTCAENAGKCFHGLGHGLMFASNNNLPASVERCKTLAKNSARIQCGEGVFMEHFNADGMVHASVLLDPGDPFLACRSVDEPYRGVCAFYAPRYYVRLHPRQYQAAIDWCASLPLASAKACVKGVGSAAMKENILDPSVVLTVCDGALGDFHPYCIEGLVSYYIVHFASVTKGRELCSKLPEADQARCEAITRQSEPFFQD